MKDGESQMPTGGVFQLGNLVLSWDMVSYPGSRAVAVLAQHIGDQTVVLWSGDVEMVRNEETGGWGGLTVEQAAQDEGIPGLARDDLNPATRSMRERRRERRARGKM